MARPRSRFSAALVLWGAVLVGCLVAAVILRRKNSPASTIRAAQDLPPSVVILPAQDLPEPQVRAAILRFQLPTKNHTLTAGQPEKFYMFVDRTVNGVAKEVWEGGMYGYVRDPRMLRDGTIIHSRFHEGMDILPVDRDRKGDPTDPVHAMADGIVVHANGSAGGSNYGKYVVIQHATNSGPFYSLYAHLSQLLVSPGSRIFCGDQLGIMGYTGTGINRRRAHVHVELNMLLSSRFSEWHARGHPQSPNSQGHFNGQNLVGIDVAGWLKVNNQDAREKLSDFVIAQGPQWKVLVPNRRKELEIAKRYPWLRLPGPASASWEIAVAASGTPISVAPSATATARATVTWVKPFGGDHKWVTREMLSGTGATASLSAHGLNYVNLITGDF